MTGQIRGRVLLVDDEPMILRCYGRVLRRAGFVVDSATDGLAAFQAYATQRFDAVVSDVNMPGESGLQLLDRLRQLDPHAAVILITAYPRPTDAALARSCGARELLEKPIDHAELVRVVDQAVMAGQAACHAGGSVPDPVAELPAPATAPLSS